MSTHPWAQLRRDAWQALDTGKPLTPREAYGDICLRYQIDDRDGLELGQCRVSRTMLAKAWRWELSTVASFLKRLQSLGLINIFPQGRKGSILARTKHEPNVNRIKTESCDGESNDSAHLGELNDGSKPNQNRIKTESKPKGGVENVGNVPDSLDNSAPSRARRSKIEDLRSSTTSVVQLTNAGAGAQVGEPVRDLTTKAGRKRAYPAITAIKRKGSTYDWPPEFAAFLAAYPGVGARKPGPGTYKSWRTVAIDVDAGAEDLLRSAQRYRAGLDKPQFARRCHGPSGWIESGDWMSYAAEQDEHVTPVGDWGGEVPGWIQIEEHGGCDE